MFPVSNLNDFSYTTLLGGIENDLINPGYGYSIIANGVKSIKVGAFLFGLSHL